MQRFQWPMWLTAPREGDDPGNDLGRARTRFLLRVAALHATQEGTLSALSSRLGLARGTIPNYAVMGATLTPDLATEIEKLTQGVCSRHFFRPDVFTTTGKRRASG